MTAAAEMINGYSRDGLRHLLAAIRYLKQRNDKCFCPRCKERPKVQHGYCDECYRAVAREAWRRKKGRLEAQAEAEGRPHKAKSWQRIEVTENTNNTFFSEHYETIYEFANNWAANIAQYTRDFDALPDYRQDIMVYIWKYSLYYDPEAGIDPRSFIAMHAKWGRSELWRKLNAKKRVFWENVLYLEDFRKPTNKRGTWEDFVQASEL